MEVVPEIVEAVAYPYSDWPLFKSTMSTMPNRHYVFSVFEIYTDTIFQLERFKGIVRDLVLNWRQMLKTKFPQLGSGDSGWPDVEWESYGQLITNQWKNIIVSDECCIRIEHDRRVCVWKMKYEGYYEPDLYGDSRNPKVQAMIWGCISWHGVGTIGMIDIFKSWTTNCGPWWQSILHTGIMFSRMVGPVSIRYISSEKTNQIIRWKSCLGQQNRLI